MSHLPASDLATGRMQTVRCSVQFLRAVRRKLDLIPGQRLITTTLLGKAPCSWVHASGNAAFVPRETAPKRRWCEMAPWGCLFSFQEFLEPHHTPKCTWRQMVGLSMCLKWVLWHTGAVEDGYTALLLSLAGKRPFSCSRMGHGTWSLYAWALSSALSMEIILTLQGPRPLFSIDTDSSSQEYFPLLWTSSALCTWRV